MSWSLIYLVGLASAVAPASVHTASAWSPDGRWLAYTVATRGEIDPYRPVWLFQSSPPGPLEPTSGPSSGSPLTFRLYATDLFGEGSALIASSPDPITAPAWRHDGGALAFARALPGSAGNSHLEIVVQEDLKRQRTLTTYPVGDAICEPNRLARFAPVWSPDGRYLAVPGPRPNSFLILRSDNGLVMKTVDNGAWPAWSPDGSRLAFVRAETSDSIQLIEGGFGPPRQVARLGQTFQSPAWARDGRSFLTITRKTADRGRSSVSLTELVRVQVETGVAETLARLSSDPLNRGVNGPSTSYDVSVEGDDLFYSNDQEGQPAAVVWFHPRTGETSHRTHPVDTTIRVGGVALSPGGKHVALRFGTPGVGMPVAIWEPGTSRLTPLVPDEMCRLEWARLLLGSALTLLREGVPPVALKGQPVERATVLPVPGEIPPMKELSLRLRRIGRIGSPLCESHELPAQPDPRIEGFFREARLFFDYIREDYPSALSSLEAVEARTSSPDLRIRLLSLRAQIFLGMGEPDQASDVADYLLTEARRGPRLWETTPAGISLGGLTGRPTGWTSFLRKRIDDRRKVAAGRSEPGDDAVVSQIREAPFAPIPGPLVPFEPRQDRFRALDEIPERLVPPQLLPDERMRFQKLPFPPR